MPVSRVTVIVTPAFDDEEAAQQWLERCHRAEEERELAIDAGIKVLNRVLHAQRASAADPYLHDVSAAQSLSIRVGYGTGGELVEGRWRAAYSMPLKAARRRDRRQMLSPQEEVAAILTGRARLEPSDDLMLRARLDFEQDRVRQAALQLRIATDALEAELREGADGGASAGQLADVSERKRLIDEIADAALRGPLDKAETTTLEEVLRDVERIVRRRRHSGG